MWIENYNSDLFDEIKRVWDEHVAEGKALLFCWDEHDHSDDIFLADLDDSRWKFPYKKFSSNGESVREGTIVCTERK